METDNWVGSIVGCFYGVCYGLGSTYFGLLMCTEFSVCVFYMLVYCDLCADLGLGC